MTAPKNIQPALFGGIDISEHPEEASAAPRANRASSAHQLRATGLSVRQIAWALNVPHGLVARWLAEEPAAPAPVKKPEPMAEALVPEPVKPEALVGLRTQLRACMAQMRGLADRLDRVEALNAKRMATLDAALRQVQAALAAQQAPPDLKAGLELQATPAPPVRRSRLAFWKGRGS